MAIKPYNYSGAQATSTPVKSGGLKPFDYSSVPQQPKQSLLDKITSGAEKVTDFLGLKGATDTIGSHIARATVAPEFKKYIAEPTAGQNLGALLEVGSLLIPATGAERIAASVAKGALAKAALRGSAAGLQFGALGGAGHALRDPNATDADILKSTFTEGAIGAAGGAALGLSGAAAGKGIAKYLEKAKPVEVPKKIPVSFAEETKIPIKTPLTKQAEYAKKQGYEPVVPDEHLPVIQAGVKEKGTLPVIQTQVKTPAVKGDFTFEPIKPTPKPVVTAPQPKEVPVATKPTTAPKAPKTSALKDIKGSTTKPAKAATDINRKLVSQGIEQLPDHELANFTPITKAEQTEKVATIMGTDLEKAQRMAAGVEKIPNDVHPQVLFNAVKNKAIKEGDGEVLRALASSPIAKQRSLAAQSLGASGFENGEVDAVKAMSDINKAREDRITRTYKDTNALKKDTVKQAKTELKKSAPTKQTVADFIQSLTC